MHGAPRRSLADRTDGGLDETGVEQRLALAGATECDEVAATIEVCDRRIRASRRLYDRSGDDELAVRIGSHGGVSAGRQRGGARVLRIRRKAGAQIAERKDRADRQAATAERSRASRAIEADRVARLESDEVRAVRHWDRVSEG